MAFKTTKVDGHTHRWVTNDRYTSVDAGHRHSTNLMRKITGVAGVRRHMHKLTRRK